MSAFRIFIIIYFAVIASLFNSKWADESLHNVPRVHQSTKQKGINFLADSYMNVKTVQVNTDAIKIFAILDASFDIHIRFYLKTNRKYYYSVNTVAKFCAIKAYLHLLQKF
ncbi:Uncharacterised protein [Chryseobacterium indoltheticum]|uniref:Uncharacterized protein n=1 Tax=Chryseobacterium indoltheticum TaxID=254 RepID=A0A381FQH4_9FLAO|nr:Uncharacterised protein [Chryseobacterium indoltheticum]